ncbi:MAG TPA: c-type cytochrome [Granulicella sp.]
MSDHARTIAGALILAVGVSTGAQTPQRQAGATQAPRLTNFPDRPKAPQEVLDRGRGMFGVNCAFCHGSDAGGGEVGPNLKRSTIVLDDQAGELIAPIVHGARVDKGMPRIDLTDAQIADIAAWLHSLPVTARTDPNAENINIVTGDAKDGEAYFQKTCAKCHSATGDLQGIASKLTNSKQLQQWWLMPAVSGRSGMSTLPAGLHVPEVTATVTLSSGETVQGVLTRVDDFDIWLTLSDGTLRAFERNGDQPKLEVHDPLAQHRELLLKYTDKNIHDVTAYLVTLK